MRALYSILMYLAIPGFLLHLSWRGLRNRGYWRRWGERFALESERLAGPYDLWVHAVSVGEVQVAAPLVKRLRERFPDLRVLVTSTTPTGSGQVGAALGTAVDHCYLPYDLPDAVLRFLDRAAPRVAVFVETELWPNYYASSARRGIPIVVANARLSARSAQGYRRLGRLVREMLLDIRVVAAQARSDGERFVALGLPAGHMIVTGSAKFDMKMPASLMEQAQVLRRRLGVDRSVWIAGSTHEGEDEIILDAFDRILADHSDALLILVPRHPERFARVAQLVRRRGFDAVLRSDRGAGTGIESAQVYVGDTMGELQLLYAASDVAFVGGSLVETGGHNMLEAAALGLPVLVGPYTFNFTEITRLLEQRGALRRVFDADSLAVAVRELLRDANQRHRMGESGRKVVDANRGALDRLVDLVARFLAPRDSS